MTTEENRRATLKELHEFDGTVVVDLAHAVTMMAIRYGAARALQARATYGSGFDYETASRARDRRFGALCRLVYALEHQS